MGTQVDIRKITRYPPECFPSAMPVDLVAGDNKVAEYARVEPYIISFRGLSFTAQDGLRFFLDADEKSEVVKKDDLASVRGLDFEEEVRQPATKYATLRIYSPSALSSYAWRHRVLVLRRTPALKAVLGVPLTRREQELVEKYNVRRAILKQVPQALDFESGFDFIRDANATLTESGTVFWYTVPSGMKLALLDISTIRPSAPASAYLTIDRDGLEEIVKLDLYCLPSLSYKLPIRIVALDKIEVKLDVVTSGTYNVRLTYGLGRLTIPEKIAWDVELSEEERRIAEEEDLFEAVEAGVM